MKGKWFVRPMFLVIVWSVLVLSLQLSEIVTPRLTTESQVNPIAVFTPNPPRIYKTTSGASLALTIPQGTVMNGGRLVPIAATTGTATASATSCTVAGIDADTCNIWYVSAAGVVAGTLNKETAFARGTTILAFIETTATTVRSIVYPPSVNLSQPNVQMQFTNCAASATCATPVTISGMAYQTAAGSATLVGGTVLVTGITPTFPNSMGCSAFLNATTATAAAESTRCVPITPSSLRITVGASASATDVMQWNAWGY